MGADSAAPGRSAITGRGQGAVWDFLSLVDRPKRGSFTSYPHLTLSVQADHLSGYVVHLPWGTKGLNSRTSLRLIAESWRAMKPLLDTVRGTPRRVRSPAQSTVSGSSAG